MKVLKLTFLLNYEFISLHVSTVSIGTLRAIQDEAGKATRTCLDPAIWLELLVEVEGAKATRKHRCFRWLVQELCRLSLSKQGAHVLLLRGGEDRRCPLIELVLAALAVHILRHRDHDWFSLKPCELSRPGQRGLHEIPIPQGGMPF